MRKKILSLVLVVAFAMSLFVVGASATSFKDDNDVVNKAAVDKMVSLNIINGRDTGNFDPKGIVTRAEMTKMICVAMSGGVDPKYNTTTTSFTDTQGHWAAGYIENGASQGIVAGMGNKIFAPDQGVTANQAAKMLLVALGYDATYETFTGPSWAINVNKIARQKGLFDELGGLEANAPMSRDNAAQMVFNFCNANMVKYTFGLSGSGSNISGVKQAEDIIINNNAGTNKYETILTKYYKLIDAKEGYLYNWTYDKDKKEYKYAIANNMDAPTGGTDATIYKTTQDFTGLYGQKVKLYFKDKNNNGTYDSNDDTIYDIAAKDSKVVASGCVGDWDTIIAKDTDFTMNGTTYKLTETANDVKVYEFGKGLLSSVPNAALTGTDPARLYNYQQNNAKLASEPYNFELIDNTGDGEGDILVVHPITVKKITYVDTKSVTTDTDTYKFDNADIFKDVAKSDWAIITKSDYSKTKRDALEKITLVTGTIQTIKSPTKIVVDGKTYLNAAGATGDTAYKLGNKMELTLVNGYIFNAKKLSNGPTKETVCLVLKANKPGTGIDEGTQDVSAVFSDGVKKTITVDEINDKAVTNDADDTKDVYFENPDVAGGTYPAHYNLYSYNKDSDGNYELTPYNAPGAPFDKGNVAKDYDKYYAGGNDGSTFFKDGKLNVKNSGTVRFDDSAVVFYVYKDGNNSMQYKVATGETVAKWAEITAAKIKFVAAYTNERDGFQYAQVAVFDLGDYIPNDDTTLYGYITADSGLTQVGNDYYYNISIWDGKTVETYLAKGTKDHSTIGSSFVTDDNVKKGTPISFTAVGDNANGSKMIDKVTSLKGTANAITAYTDGKNFVGFQKAIDGQKDLKITSDTKVIRFGSEKTEKAEGNGITVAKETSVAGVYYNNCYVEANSDNEIKVLIIDKDSSLATDAAGLTGNVTPEQVNTKDKLNAAFAAADTVKVTSSYTLPTDVTTIADGKNLIVEGALTVSVGHNLAVNGTVTATGTLNADATISGTGTVTAKTVNTLANVTATNVVINGDYTFATGTIANKVTVNGTATVPDAVTLTVNGTGTLTVNGAVATAGTGNIAGAGTVTAASYGDYSKVAAANIVVTGKVDAPKNLLGKNYTFQGDVTAALTFDTASKVTFEKAVSIAAVIDAVAGNQTAAGAQVKFLVTPSAIGTVVVNTANGFFSNEGTLALTLKGDITTSVFYTNTANKGDGTHNGWIR